MTPIAARCRLLLTGVAAVAASALLAAPALAAEAPTAVSGCAPTPVVQPFAQWGDHADYFLAPDGGFERGAAGWTLAGAARTSGNEPFGPGASSLGLPAGSSATSAPFCIGVEHRTMRFFTKAASASMLDVDAIVPALPGVAPRTVRIATLRGSDAWAPTVVVPMVVNALAATTGNALTVRLRFTPRDAGAWTMDDVYIDPFRLR